MYPPSGCIGRRAAAHLSRRRLGGDRLHGDECYCMGAPDEGHVLHTVRGAVVMPWVSVESTALPCRVVSCSDAQRYTSASSSTGWITRSGPALKFRTSRVTK
jgi:hypothetical protein